MACNCSPIWTALARCLALPTALLPLVSYNPKTSPVQVFAADRRRSRSAQDSDPGDMTLDSPFPPLNPQLPVSLLLGLATGSVLVGLQVGKGVLSALVELGEMSEEILRGDRLPTLKTQPDLESPETDSSR